MISKYPPGALAEVLDSLGNEQAIQGTLNAEARVDSPTANDLLLRLVLETIKIRMLMEAQTGETFTDADAEADL